MPTAEANALTVTPPPAVRRWTYDELVAELPETNQPSELWDGELIMSPAPHPKHQEIVFQLARLLEDFVTARQLGRIYLSPLDIVLGPTRVVQPDVVYIATANRGIIQDRIRGVPDLVVEVTSAGSWRRDRVDKRALYEQFGVAEYWIVDLEAQTIEVFALVNGTYQVHRRAAAGERADSRLLAGFAVTFAQLESPPAG